jgi:hypothetical protein
MKHLLGNDLKVAAFDFFREIPSTGGFADGAQLALRNIAPPAPCRRRAFVSCSRRKFIMRRLHSVETLNRLFTLQYRSLPQYLMQGSFYFRPGDERIVEAIREVVRRQETACRRIADLILHRRGQLPNSAYPMRYASTHDLDLRFLLNQLIEEQRLVVKEIARLAATLKHDRTANALGQEILDQETDHLQRFAELAAEFAWDAQPCPAAAAEPKFLIDRQHAKIPRVARHPNELATHVRRRSEVATSRVAGPSRRMRAAPAADEMRVGG